MGVEGRVAAQPGKRAVAEVDLVLGPLSPHAGRDREEPAGDLAVRVDRVAEVDVEVVALRPHPPVDAAAVPVRRALVGGPVEVRVAGPAEGDPGVPGSLRSCPERPLPALAVAADEAEPVALACLQAADLPLHRVVARPARLESVGLGAPPPEAPIAGDLEPDRRLPVRAGPEDGRGRRHVAGRHAVLEADRARAAG